MIKNHYRLHVSLNTVSNATTSENLKPSAPHLSSLARWGWKTASILKTNSKV